MIVKHHQSIVSERDIDYSAAMEEFGAPMDVKVMVSHN